MDELAEVPEPPALSLSDAENLIKIQTLFDDRWILIQLVPGQVWPLVSQYAVQQGMGVERELASEGVIETSWLLKTNDESLREKYRFQIKQGVQRRSTEVSLLQYETGRDAPYKPVDWSQKALDKASAEQTLESLARFLADYADPSAAVSLRAQNVNTESRLYLDVETEPTLMVKLGRERGLASVAYALDKSGFNVNDTIQAEGKFYARPIIEKDERSAVGRLFSRLAFYSDKPDSKADIEYIFTLNTADNGWLSLTVSSEEPLSKSDKKSVLKEVKRNLT